MVSSQAHMSDSWEHDYLITQNVVVILALNEVNDNVALSKFRCKDSFYFIG